MGKFRLSSGEIYHYDDSLDKQNMKNVALRIAEVKSSSITHWIAMRLDIQEAEYDCPSIQQYKTNLKRALRIKPEDIFCNKIHKE